MMGEKIEFEATVEEGEKTQYDECSMYTVVFACIRTPPEATKGQRYHVTLEPIEPGLEPCPFCGSAGSDLRNAKWNNERWSVACAICHAEGPLVRHKRGAAGDWNRRKP